jgi:hypothetical protein
MITSCSPELPACGAPGVVSIATIVRDLADPEVQAALSHPSRQVYGLGDSRSQWSIFIPGRMAGIAVGSPCPSPVTGSCVPTPAGVQRLLDDLKSLAALCPWS